MALIELVRVNLFWFNRDLRLDDNKGLSKALNADLPVLPIYIFDPGILERLEDPSDPRVSFIHQQLQLINSELIKYGSTLTVLHGTVTSVFESLIKQYHVKTVFTNHDYEPYTRELNRTVREWLHTQSVGFETYKDHVILEKKELVKSNGQPYTVFTPYMKQWKLKLLSENHLISSSDTNFSNFLPLPAKPIFALENIGFKESSSPGISPPNIDLSKISQYHLNRNYPGICGTTRLSVHLRFGTISIRNLVRIAADYNETWLNELIWREFYMMILWNFPRVEKEAFKPAYNYIPWVNNPELFRKWCDGITGYPMVDAGMRELNKTGFMHNRLRMITASFLTKHLLINWQWGEAYFANKLLDYELSSNNGGWQWAAGCGCDAAPYFRVFNPSLQAKKFDPESKYILKWIPDVHLSSYPQPIVNHQRARARAIETYKSTLNQYSRVKVE